MADSADIQSGFLARLKQHHIYRVAVGYGTAIAVLIQVVARAFPYFGWSAAVPAVIIILVASFPVAIVLAWLLVKPAKATNQPVWRKRHWTLGAVITPLVIAAVVVSGIFALRFSALHEARLVAAQAAAQAATPSFDPPAGTLVVLPFTSLNGDPKQQYFSDGITEELTSALGQNAALRVIAWDTASRFRNTQQNANEVGHSLNVANLLHGSIEREGGQVRVIAELVDTRTGTEIWSAHYDDSLANIFRVQDTISAAIAGALKVKFASLGAAPTVNPEAHDLVLKARALMDKARTAAPLEQARKLYEQAIALDPDYSDAHAGLARAWFVVTQYSTLSLKKALPKAREEAHKALALEPRNVEALVELANADISEGKLTEARAYYERALALNPSNAIAHLDYGTLLPLQQSLAQMLEAVQLDPDNATAQYNAAGLYLDLGEYPQALAPRLTAMRLDPHSVDNALDLAETYTLLHRNQDAVKAFDFVQPDTPLAKVLLAAERLTYQSLLDPKLHAQAQASVEGLRKRSDLDPLSMEDVIQLELVLGQNRTALELLPKFCAAAPVGCNDLSIYPMWLPLRGDPRFQQLVRQYDTVSKPQE